jgi:hypothetical protein
MVAQLTQGLLNTHANVTGRGSSSSRGGSSAGRPGSASLGGSASAAGGFELDLARTGRLVGFSALVGTPVAFVWFSLLDQVRVRPLQQAQLTMRHMHLVLAHSF